MIKTRTLYVVQEMERLKDCLTFFHLMLSFSTTVLCSVLNMAAVNSGLCPQRTLTSLYCQSGCDVSSWRTPVRLIALSVGTPQQQAADHTFFY